MKKISERAVELMVERNKKQDLEAIAVFKGKRTWHDYMLSEVPSYPSPSNASPGDILNALDEYQSEQLRGKELDAVVKW